jgi:PAS domain S-box-containing protein
MERGEHDNLNQIQADYDKPNLATLYELSTAVARARDVSEIHEIALDTLQAVLGADRASVLLFDPDGVIRFKAWRNLSPEYREAVTGHSPWQPDTPNPQAFAVSDVLEDRDLAPYRETITGEGIRALGFIPLVFESRVLGKFMIYYNEPREFRQQELQLAETIANHVAFAIGLKQAEVKLQLYRNIFQNSIDGIAIIDTQGKYIEQNTAHHRLLGFTDDDLKDQTPAIHLGDKMFAEVAADLQAAGVYRGETTSVAKDGTELDVELAAFTVYDSEGDPSCFVGIKRDVGRRKRAESALRDSEERLRLALEAGRMGTWQWDVKSNEVSWSAALEEIHGIVPGSFGGTFEAFLSDMHPEDVPKVTTAIRQTLELRKDHHIEYRILPPDGQVRWVEGRGKLFLDGDGEPDRMVGVCMDVTERKRSEQALRESEERFRNMADAAPVLIWTADTDSQSTYFNRPWLEFTGRTLEQELGEGWREGIHPEDDERCRRIRAEAYAKRVPFRKEFRLRRHDGQYRWIIDHGVPRFAADGSFIGYIGSGIDVTQERELKDELERRVKERTMQLEMMVREMEGFTYSVSHDMRTPIRNIVVNSRMILEDLGDKLEGQSRKDLEELATSAQYMAQLIEDLLRYARLGQVAIKEDEVDLSDLARTVSAQVLHSRPECSESNVTIQPGLTARGDAEQFRMLLENLFDNSCKYRQADRPLEIEFGAKPSAQGPVFFVRDNGIGFDMSYSGRLFIPFERLHRSSDYPGTGIGLANVKRIVERHGGRVWAEASPNKGATFHFTLPRAASSGAKG